MEGGWGGAAAVGSSQAAAHGARTDGMPAFLKLHAITLRYSQDLYRKLGPSPSQLTKQRDAQRVRHPVQRRSEVAGGIPGKGQQRDQHVLQDHVEPRVLGGAGDQHEQGLGRVAECVERSV